MPIEIQRRHPYTAKLKTETRGDSENMFLHQGVVFESSQTCHWRCAGDAVPGPTDEDASWLLQHAVMPETAHAKSHACSAGETCEEV